MSRITNNKQKRIKTMEIKSFFYENNGSQNIQNIS